MSMHESFLKEVAPWPEPVAASTLLSLLEEVISRHVVLDRKAALLLAYWVLHTYIFESGDVAVYVVIESPEKRCGKTTLLTVLAGLVHKPIVTSNITTGALFAAIDEFKPTLLIDEADTYLRGNTAMRGVLNAGNARETAFVLRLGKRFETVPADATSPSKSGQGVVRYNCWCPKAIALIGSVPETIADRAIVVRLNRKLTTEPSVTLKDFQPEPLRRKCLRFALDMASRTGTTQPFDLPALNDRAAQVYGALSIIAGQAGAEREAEFKEIATAFAGEGASDSEGVETLLDVLTVFVESGQDKMFTAELAEAISSGLYTVGPRFSEKPLSPAKLCCILRQYGVKTHGVRVGTRVSKGFASTDFREALHRYTPRDLIDRRMEEIHARGELDRERGELVARLAERDQILRGRKLPCFVCGGEADSFWIYGVRALSEPLCLTCARGLKADRPDVDEHMPPDLSTEQAVTEYAALLKEQGHESKFWPPSVEQRMDPKKAALHLARFVSGEIGDEDKE
jgi:hypothetical protein